MMAIGLFWSYLLLYGLWGCAGYLLGVRHGRRALRANLPTARAIETGDVGRMPPTSEPNPPRIPAPTRYDHWGDFPDDDPARYLKPRGG